jgi:hypothetical protein
MIHHVHFEHIGPVDPQIELDYLGTQAGLTNKEKWHEKLFEDGISVSGDGLFDGADGRPGGGAG